MTLAIVTGAPGWLGTQLTLTLARDGRAVRCLVLKGQDTSALPDAVEIVSGDLRDPQACDTLCRSAKGATVFHCAGVIHPGWRTRDFWDVNVEGTRNLVHAAQRAGVRRLVAVSSNSPMGTNAPGEVFTEDSPYRPYMGYGKSKVQMERVVMGAELEWVIIRPPWFYGVGQPPRQSLFFEMIRDGKGPLVGPGDNLRSMAYIDNIVQGLSLCETTPRAEGQTYWIADERPYRMREILDTVEALMRDEFGITCRGGRLRLPAVVGPFATACDALLQRVGLYQQKVHVLGELDKNIACSIDKARSELGYNPAIALEEGMRRSIAWWLEQ
jgi:nucleoside-diphosphate-sugar epimerase